MSTKSQRRKNRHRVESEPFLFASQQHDKDIELGDRDDSVNDDDDGEDVVAYTRGVAHRNSTKFSSTTTAYLETGRQSKEVDLRSPTLVTNIGIRRGNVSSPWLRLFSFSRRSSCPPESPFSDELKGQRSRGCLGRCEKAPRGRKRGLCTSAIRLCMYCLMFLGTTQFVALTCGIATAFFPDHFAALYRSRQDEDGISHWPTDFSADILPVRCHSHNDYWRRVPFFDAIHAGCTGVEADVWLYNDELYVGHTESSLTPNRTLKSLYVEPLLHVLKNQNPESEFQPIRNTPRNGVFDTDISQPLVLLIDFKTNGDALWPVVQQQLEPLRSKHYLTYFNGSVLIPGPVIVVATGNAPFHKVIANTTYRDIFFDAPLVELAKLVPPTENSSAHPVAISLSSPATPKPYEPSIEQEYLNRLKSYATTSATITTTGEDTTPRDKGQGYSGALVPSNSSIYTVYNSYYASTSFKATFPIQPFPYLTASQRTVLENQIRGAHIQGLQARYWSVPAWPVSWRHYLWRELLKLGIDYLNVDDLEDATKGDWLSSGAVGKAIWGIGGW